MSTNPHGETIALDDLPDIPPLVRNARVAANVLFVDPPAAYAVSVYEHEVTIQGDGIDDWIQRHHLTPNDIEYYDGPKTFREYVGVIEGVPFRAVSVTR